MQNTRVGQNYGDIAGIYSGTSCYVLQSIHIDHCQISCSIQEVECLLLTTACYFHCSNLGKTDWYMTAQVVESIKG